MDSYFVCLLSVCILGLFEPGQCRSIDQVITDATKTSGPAKGKSYSKAVRVELDILYTPNQWRKIQKMRRKGRGGVHKRNALKNLRSRWPNNIIPYTIASSFSSDDKNEIQKSFADWHKYTCLKFRPREAGDRNYIKLVDGYGCSSYVGVIGRPQEVTLAHGCRTKGIITHELGHAIGFQHEQTRPDRDNYVTIKEENIVPRNLFNFEKYDDKFINTYGVPYDYKSIMHYGQYAFSKNGKPTIITKDLNAQNQIGSRYDHSFWDLKLTNLMYNCHGHCSSTLSCPDDGFLGKDCQCWCRGAGDRLAVECEGGSGDGERDQTYEFKRYDEVDCFDSHDYCSSWAAHGDCSNVVIAALCSSSCNNC